MIYILEEKRSGKRCDLVFEKVRAWPLPNEQYGIRIMVTGRELPEDLKAIIAKIYANKGQWKAKEGREGHYFIYYEELAMMVNIFPPGDAPKKPKGVPNKKNRKPQPKNIEETKVKEVNEQQDGQ